VCAFLNSVCTSQVDRSSSWTPEPRGTAMHSPAGCHAMRNTCADPGITRPLTVNVFNAVGSSLMSQIRTVPSALLDARNSPRGSNVTQSTCMRASCGCRWGGKGGGGESVRGAHRVSVASERGGRPDCGEHHADDAIFCGHCNESPLVIVRDMPDGRLRANCKPLELSLRIVEHGHHVLVAASHEAGALRPARTSAG